jgi:SAM-dependent methyltransferase
MNEAKPRSRRLAALYEFVLEQVPPPARVLEIGCGDGELARALAGAGYSVTAIDPRAPEGPIFRRNRLEDFSDDDAFDAVVASVSLHHVEDLDAAADKVRSVLRRGGLLIVEEFARELFAGATARWYFDQLRALAIEEPEPDDFEEWLRRWNEEHPDVHPFADLKRAIDARFTERHFAWTPYLYDYRLGDSLEPLERELIQSGAIDATGVRYVGERLL